MSDYSSSWFETLPGPAVRSWIDKNGEAAKKAHGTDNVFFALWLHYLDRAVRGRVWMSYRDMEDYDYWAMYEAGYSPKEAAEQMLEDSDWAGQW